MKHLSLTGFVALALFACILFAACSQVAHADSPNGPHGGHPPVVSNGQGQVSKGNDPVPHVNYGLHKGQEKKDPVPENTPVPAAKPTAPAIVPVPQLVPPTIVPSKEPDGKKDDKDWSLYPVCQTGLTTDITLSEPDGEHALCFYGWYSTGGR